MARKSDSWGLKVEEVAVLVGIIKHKISQGLVPLWVKSEHHEQARQVLIRENLYTAPVARRAE